MSRRVVDRWKWACTFAAPRLTGAQRAVLHVLAAHAQDGGTIVGQETMAQSAGITDRAVRNALRELEALGLITSMPRPGKSTLWTINTAWTPEADFRPPRKPTSTVREDDPGSTPEAPRNSASDEIGSVRTTSFLPTEAKDVRQEGSVIDITNALAANLSMVRKAASRPSHDGGRGRKHGGSAAPGVRHERTHVRVPCRVMADHVLTFTDPPADLQTTPVRTRHAGLSADPRPRRPRLRLLHRRRRRLHAPCPSRRRAHHGLACLAGRGQDMRGRERPRRRR
jgi:hypothetical protein